jgi:restriction system protein
MANTVMTVPTARKPLAPRGCPRDRFSAMAVPDFQTIMGPMLAMLGDRQERSVTELRARLADHFSLTPEDLAAEIPSGRAKLFANRVGWATTHLYRSGVIERPKRSVYRITPRGEEVLAQHPDRVDLKVLSQFPEFHEFRGKTPTDDATQTTSVPTSSGGPEQTPEEEIDGAYRLLRTALAAELLDRVKEQSPTFFEQLVLDVLRAMGYGGTHEGAVSRLGQSGDEGVIREDELGLDLIYVQAKRWQNPVGRPEIQKFFGALHGKRASKGVFITTSSFFNEAATYAESATPRVILVDGRELSRLMIDYGVGVTSTRRYEIKRIDLDYFASEDEAASGSADCRNGPWYQFGRQLKLVRVARRQLDRRLPS